MTNKNNKTIKIAGAGISGLTSAIVLAKAGYKVKVFEKNDQVGKRFNEDFQGLMNWGFDIDILDYMKQIGLETNFWYKPLLQYDLYISDKYKYYYSMGTPLAYLIKRGDSKQSFDKFLLTLAINNGVEVLFNSPKERDEVDIIATGPNLNRATNMMAHGYTFKTNSSDVFAGVFDKKLAYKGYAYFFIVDGNGTIATCIFGNFNRLSGYLDKTLSFFKKNYDFDIRNKTKFTAVGNFYLLNTKEKYTGEAGGFQDFLWGFGMRYAIITGNLAARSIIENKNYKELRKKELGGLLKTSIANRFCFSLLGKHSYKYFIRMLNKYEDPKEFLAKVYRPNIYSKILYPIARIYFGKYTKDRSGKI